MDKLCNMCVYKLYIYIYTQTIGTAITVGHTHRGLMCLRAKLICLD